MKGKVEEEKRKGREAREKGRKGADHGIGSPRERALGGKKEGWHRRPQRRGE